MYNILKFSLTDKEKEMLREYNEEWQKKFQDKLGMTYEEAIEQILVGLYNEIGVSNYNIYRDVNENPDNIEGNTRSYLTAQAIATARLQVLLEDMDRNGKDISGMLEFTERASEHSKPITIYHGTSDERLSEGQIGAPDEQGFYHVQEGIGYWTLSEKKAREVYSTHKYPSQGKKENINIGSEKERQPLSRIIRNSDNCRVIPKTHEGAFVMWQDELVRMSKNGVQYLFPESIHISQGDIIIDNEAGGTQNDIMDISNFADFIQKRDRCIDETLQRLSIKRPKEQDSLLRIS